MSGALRVFGRLAQLVGIAALITAGTLLIVEAVEPARDGAREDLASFLDGVAEPDAEPWLLALVGCALAVLAVAAFAGQLVTKPTGSTLMLNVDRDQLGSTDLSGRALISAIERRVRDIEGVVDSQCAIRKKAVDIELRVDDRANLDQVDATVRQRLDHAFWIDLGLADMAVDITIVHHPRPPRVR